jgi:hypothetical protein
MDYFGPLPPLVCHFVLFFKPLLHIYVLISKTASVSKFIVHIHVGSLVIGLALINLFCKFLAKQG